jgi:site-specific recombinase XerD
LKADITNFKWHDLRHTWASWLVQSGGPLYDLKEMGGWEMLEKVQRYAHLEPEHLHQHSKHINLLDVTNMAHEKSTLRLLAKVS